MFRLLWRVILSQMMTWTNLPLWRGEMGGGGATVWPLISPLNLRRTKLNFRILAPLKLMKNEERSFPWADFPLPIEEVGNWLPFPAWKRRKSRVALHVRPCAFQLMRSRDVIVMHVQCFGVIAHRLAINGLCHVTESADARCGFHHRFRWGWGVYDGWDFNLRKSTRNRDYQRDYLGQHFLLEFWIFLASSGRPRWMRQIRKARRKEMRVWHEFNYLLCHLTGSRHAAFLTNSGKMAS